MLTIVLWFLKVWVKDYEKMNGDGCGQKFFEWCVKKYVKNVVSEKEWKELLEKTETTEIMEDK